MTVPEILSKVVNIVQDYLEVEDEDTDPTDWMNDIIQVLLDAGMVKEKEDGDSDQEQA